MGQCGPLLQAELTPGSAFAGTAGERMALSLAYSDEAPAAAHSAGPDCSWM
jgi:hypothetical protein